MMTWFCPRCKRREVGPPAARHLCGICRGEMVPVVEQVAKDGKKTEVILEKLED